MSIKSKALKLATLAVIGGLSVACGSQSGSSDGSSAGESGNSPATTRTTADTSSTGWFEPAGTYEMALESEDGYRLEGIVHVGNPTRISEAPMPYQYGSFDDCGNINAEPTEADVAFPVSWKFTNATEADGFDFVANVGVLPESPNSDTSYAEYEDGSLACMSGDSVGDWFGGKYDIDAGDAVTGEGFVFYHDYFTPDNQEGAVEETLPRIEVIAAAPDLGDVPVVELTGPGVNFEEQKTQKDVGTVGLFDLSDVTLLLPIGRTSEDPDAYEDTYTNGGVGTETLTGQGSAAEQFDQTWAGQITQTGDDGAVTGEYGVEADTIPVSGMTEDLVGEVVGEVSYADLDCSGVWVLDEVNEDSVEVREQIEEGVINCIEYVSITLTPQENGTLEYYFRDIEYTDSVGKGVLTRTGNG